MPTAPTIQVAEPVYQQLLRICRDQLRDGTLKGGDKFPSERDLASQYKVSRVTVNKVVSTLVNEGQLIYRPGIGTFVKDGADRLRASLHEMYSFTHQARAMGWVPKTEVLEFQSLTATGLPTPVRSSLELEDQPEASVLFIKRLRLADGIPVILEKRWVQASRVPGLNRKDLKGSFYQCLETKYHLKPSQEILKIRACALHPDDADLLLDTKGSPSLEVSGPGFAGELTPLWHQVLLYRADRYELLNTFRESPNGYQCDASLQPSTQK